MCPQQHSASLAQRLKEEVDLGESNPGGFHDPAVFSMRATDSPTGQVPGAKPSPNNMPVSWYDVQDLQQVQWAETEVVSSNGPAWTSSRGPGIRLYCPRRMMKK